MWIGAIIFLALMPALWAYRDPLGFPNNDVLFKILGRTITKKKLWHWLGWVLRAATAIFIITDPLLTIAYGFYFWIVFELITGKRTQNDWFFQDKSSTSGEVLSSFYISGKVIFAIKLVLMIIFLTIKYI